ncbi:MAG: hypothetical protein KJO55_07125 [Gammaproteobacteria bacterium]|nr:hypothetical protein [Gammaproteobacteria bacterium]
MTNTAPSIALVFWLTACAASPSDGYERHGLSRLVEVPGSSSEFVYEVGRPPPGPLNSEAEAEAVRMRWLAEWLTLRGQCLSGHEIVDRRQFGPQEYNPMQAELRYLIRCRAAQADDPRDQ